MLKVASVIYENKETCCLTWQVSSAQIPDFQVMTVPAPANPISPVTFTGFTFSPRQKFYSMFQDGVLAKLAVSVQATFLSRSGRACQSYWPCSSTKTAHFGTVHRS
jgi:hypothetical protein